MIKTADLIKTFFRSFLIQVGKNRERMQSLGFLYAMLPTLKKLYPEDKSRKEALSRHLEFFNTHPYFAAPILGIVISLEEEVARGNRAKVGEILHVKSVFGGPLAALGDAFFWGTWRPFLALVACLMVLFTSGSLFGPILFLVFYNFPHLWFRWVGIWQGYQRKTGVIELIKQINFTRLMRLTQYLLLVLLLVFAIGWAVYGPGPFFKFFAGWELSGSGAISKRLAIVGAVLILSFLHRRGINSIKLFYGITVLSIIIACLR